MLDQRATRERDRFAVPPRNARAADLRGRRDARPPAEPVTLRLGRPQDDDALGRLAQLNKRPAPRGPHVVAKIEGTVVAAIPLGPGEALGDPFRPTAALISLLEVRARQLTDRRRRLRPLTLRRASRSGALNRVATEGR